MDWNDLRIFLAIAREGSLSAAARSLGQSQPTMGRRLQALEAAVGQRLFQRTADGFLLTGEGTVALSHVERMEQEALAVLRHLAGRNEDLAGALRVTASDWFAVHVLAPVLGEFAILHPRVTVEMLSGPRTLSLSRREADLAFRTMPFDEPEIVSRRLARVDYAAYVRAGSPHPERGDGAGTTLITTDATLADRPEASWLRRALPNARIAFRSNNRDVQARLCLRGIGVAVLPRPLGDSFEDLTRIDPAEPPPPRHAWIGYHRDLRGSARLRALLDLVVERLAD